MSYRGIYLLKFHPLFLLSFKHKVEQQWTVLLFVKHNQRHGVDKIAVTDQKVEVDIRRRMEIEATERATNQPRASVLPHN